MTLSFVFSFVMEYCIPQIMILIFKNFKIFYNRQTNYMVEC